MNYLKSVGMTLLALINENPYFLKVITLVRLFMIPAFF
jgi:hypothetical protein